MCNKKIIASQAAKDGWPIFGQMSRADFSEIGPISPAILAKHRYVSSATLYPISRAQSRADRYPIYCRLFSSPAYQLPIVSQTFTKYLPMISQSIIDSLPIFSQTIIDSQPIFSQTITDCLVIISQSITD